MSTLKADTLQAKTTDGTLTLANNGSGKVELPADATIGGVALGSDQVARDMASSALAYALVQNDATSIVGPVGTFWLSDDFETDNLATKTNATYSATGDYYSNPGLPTIGTVQTAATSGEVSTSPHTFSSINIGTAAADRKIIIGIQGRPGSVGADVTAITVGGISATFHAVADREVSSRENHVEIWSVDVPTGTSADVVVTFTTTQAIQIHVLPIYGAGAAETAYSDTDGGAAPTYSVSATGAHVSFASSEGASAFTWTGLTELSDVYANSNQTSLAYNIGTLSSTTVTATPGSSNKDVMVGISFASAATPLNMTLVPTADTLTTASPTDILAYVIIDPVDEITVGTDILMTMSIDGGTTDATGSWTLLGELGSTGEFLYRVEADVSAQTGSSLTYEITTANTKEIRYHDCVGLVPIY